MKAVPPCVSSCSSYVCMSELVWLGNGAGIKTEVWCLHREHEGLRTGEAGVDIWYHVISIQSLPEILIGWFMLWSPLSHNYCLSSNINNGKTLLVEIVIVNIYGDVKWCSWDKLFNYKAGNPTQWSGEHKINIKNKYVQCESMSPTVTDNEEINHHKNKNIQSLFSNDGFGVHLALPTSPGVHGLFMR